jgi:hypothetical protein
MIYIYNLFLILDYFLKNLRFKRWEKNSLKNDEGEK